MIVKNYCYSELSSPSAIEGKIYCFGTGKVFAGLIRKIIEAKCVERLEACVDNYKNGTIDIEGMFINTISVDDFLSRVRKEDYLIISVADYEPIIEQLSKLDIENKITYSVYFALDAAEYDYRREKKLVPKQLNTATKQLIPKVLHYCWFGKGEIPDDCKRWMETWYKYCPDYTIKRWDETNYDVEKIKYTRQAYEAKKWAFVSDYARLDIIYNEGGVYLDVDVELKNNIDILLYNKAFCGFESENYVNFGLGYGSMANNPLLNEIKEVYEYCSFCNGNNEYNLTTCPVIQTEILEKHGLKRNGEYQFVDGFVVYPEIVLNGISQATRCEIKNLKNTYMSHHYYASWDEGIRDYYQKRMVFYM